MRRILHIIESLGYNGVASQLLVLAKALVKSDLDVHVCVLSADTPRQQDFAAAGITAHTIARRWALDPLADWQLVRLVGKLQPDVVHTWDTVPGMLGPIRAGRPRVWPVVMGALVMGAAWPSLIDHPAVLTLATVAGAVAATVGARRAAGRHRPAIGFLAGWATALASAALAELASERFGLSAQAVSAEAILPAAAFGTAAQMWIGPSVGYSVALIWAFCGLALSTMGSDPMIALAAIIGISAMATVLIRAAS